MGSRTKDQINTKRFFDEMKGRRTPGISPVDPNGTMLIKGTRVRFTMADGTIREGVVTSYDYPRNKLRIKMDPEGQTLRAPHRVHALD